ncbi:MAG TPA: GLPGLI family protein [Bacteroidales bacterium]|nr:GLPGLI family protein [Bacteroidales bacterium]
MKGMISIFLFLFAISIFAEAQNTSGKIRYTVKHDWVKKIIAVDYMSKSRREQYQYMWGSSSEYTEKSVLVFNSNSYFYEEPVDEESNYGYSWKTSEYFIFRDKQTNSTYDVIRFQNKLYVIEDSIQYPKWKILNDLKEVAGHICMNASWYDEIKMNNVVAWFALDWPGNFGPERYGGLPGVILEIDVNNGAQVITADKIEFFESDTIINKPAHKKKHKKINEEYYNELLVKYINDCKKQEMPYFWGVRY